jgi:hypothetical protein
LVPWPISVYLSIVDDSTLTHQLELWSFHIWLYFFSFILMVNLQVSILAHVLVHQNWYTLFETQKWQLLQSLKIHHCCSLLLSLLSMMFLSQLVILLPLTKGRLEGYWKHLTLSSDFQQLMWWHMYKSLRTWFCLCLLESMSWLIRLINL